MVRSSSADVAAIKSLRWSETHVVVVWRVVLAEAELRGRRKHKLRLLLLKHKL